MANDKSKAFFSLEEASQQLGIDKEKFIFYTNYFDIPTEEIDGEWFISSAELKYCLENLERLCWREWVD